MMTLYVTIFSDYSHLQGIYCQLHSVCIKNYVISYNDIKTYPVLHYVFLCFLRCGSRDGSFLDFFSLQGQIRTIIHC